MIMKLCVLLLSCAVTLSLMGDSGRCTNQEVSRWIGSSLAQIEKLQVGMTRADVERFFVTDGGLSPLDRQTYVFRDCPYIKIDVEFALMESGKIRSGDRITVVSKPYLAQPRGD
jgi:hypothetical protein